MFAKILVVSIFALTLFGCHNNASTDVKGNLYVSDVLLQTAKPLGYKDQFTVEYMINATNIAEQDVAIDFYIIETSSTPEDVGNISVNLDNAHFLKSIKIEKVSTGTYSESVDLVVPNIAGIAGEYLVVAVIDPNSEIEETNENDNWLTLEMIDSMSDEERESLNLSAYSNNTIVITAPIMSDIIIDEYDISQTAIIFNTPAKLTESALTSDLVGYIEARYGGPVMPDTVLQADVFIDGTWQPLHFWNTNQISGEDEYKTSLPYLFEHRSNEEHIGFDIVFDHAYLTTLYNEYDSTIQNTLKIRFNLKPAPNSDFEDTNTDNNIVNVTLPYYFFDDGQQQAKVYNLKSSLALVVPNKAEAARAFIDLNRSYNKIYGNKSKIAAEIKLDGGVSVDPIRVGGSAYASGGFNAHMFKASHVIVGVDFKANAYLLDETGYSLDMTFLNTTVFSMEETQQGTGEDELPTWSVGHEKKWERSRDLVESRFFVGPIPLSVTAGVSGNIGFGIEAGYNGRLFIEGDLFSAVFSGYALGGIDLLLVEAGITIAIIIIENNFTLNSSLGLALARDSIAPVITYEALLVDKLDVIKGEFGLFAKVVGIQWCKKWFIYYPCGTKANTYTFWFYQTPSLFDKEFTLYSKEGSIEL